jgi:hypothetical protein
LKRFVCRICSRGVSNSFVKYFNEVADDRIVKSGIAKIRRSCHRGAVYVEAAVILPALIFITASGIDIGLLFSDYLFLSEISREVTLRISRIPRLSEFGNAVYTCDEAPSETLVSQCAEYSNTGIAPSGMSNTAPCGHIQACYYGQQLAGMKRVWTLDRKVQITSQLTTNVDNPALCNVLVAIHATHRGYFSTYRGTPVAILSKSLYLSAPYVCT